jgi:hypothetical protein
MHSKWTRRIGIAALVGGLGLASYSFQVTSATGAQDFAGNPFRVILNKLDEILDAIKGGGGTADLSAVTQNWDKNLPSNARFTVLASFNNEAVRDNNTGLVWERSQDLTPHTWINATWYCANKMVGGTVGWRLPSVVELKSVQDVSAPFPANINSVFNFTGGGADNWWSATTSGVASTDAWIVDVNGGRVNGNSKANGQGLAWCVRGPMNADTY